MTRINPDDPKWTAYVFNELSESERAAVEFELEASEDARMLVEELRFAAELTKMELHDAVKIVPLTREERKKIGDAALARRKRWLGVRPAAWMSGLAATAAAAIVLAVLSRQPQASLPIAARQESAITAEVKQPEAEATAPSVDQPKRLTESRVQYKDRALPAVRPQIAESKTSESALDSKIIDSLIVEPPTTPATAGRIPQTLPAVPPAITAPEVVTARMNGNVVDAAAARIPGVRVTATKVDNGTAATTITNESGGYSFEGLVPGNYKLSAELPGFQTSMYDGIQLSANVQKVQDITLQIAAVAESVEVTIQANTLTTQSSSGISSGRAVAAPQIRQRAEAAPPPSIAVPRARSVAVEPDRIRPPVYNGGETYDRISDNPFLRVAQNPLSTFAIDVDTAAAYSNVRRYLDQYQLPPRDAVRIEEMINYFSYDYPQPSGNNPVGVLLESASAPWNPQHRLVRVGIKARDIDTRRRPSSTPVAKDVRVQVEFNPAVVDAYRLIGYENRVLANEDFFNDDLKNGGDMGSGHTVTILYEVVPRGVPISATGAANVDQSKYAQQGAPSRNTSDKTLTVKIRYKEPTGTSSKLLSFPMVDREQTFAKSTGDFRFAAAVAAFGMILRDSPYGGTATLDTVQSIAEGSVGSDRNGYRREFLQLVARARQIRGR